MSDVSVVFFFIYFFLGSLYGASVVHILSYEFYFSVNESSRTIVDNYGRRKYVSILYVVTVRLVNMSAGLMFQYKTATCFM